MDNVISPNAPGFRVGQLMDTPTMLAWIKSDPVHKAKRLGWEWAYLQWNEHRGPTRGDMRDISRFDPADWVATDWTARP